VLDGIYEDHYETLSVVSYHAWWPGSNDPYYQANISENTARINYYGADYTPHLWIDGDVDGQYFTSNWNSQITAEEAVPSPMVINLLVDHDEPTNSGTITAVISGTDVMGHDNLMVRFAIIESDLPPAGGYTNPINHAMRDMVPDPTGLDLSISQGQIVMKQVDYVLDDTWVFENLDVVVFVQCDDEHRVLQASRFTMPGTSVSVYPSDSIVVPMGGTLNFETQIVNHRDNTANGDFWLTIVLPNSSEIVIPKGLLNHPNPTHEQVSSWGSLDISSELSIPGGVETGMYTIVGKIGLFPDVVRGQSSFDFMVTE
jgi:hypothetical protein